MLKTISEYITFQLLTSSMHSTSLKIEHTDNKKIIKIHTMYIKWMPIFFYGKEFTNIGSIGIKDKKKKPPE